MCVAQDRSTIDWIWLQIQRSLLLCDSSGDVRQKINVVEPLGLHLHTYNISSLRFFIPDGVWLAYVSGWLNIPWNKRERQQLSCNFKYFVGLIVSNTFCYSGLSEDFLLFFSHSTLIYESFKHKNHDEPVFCLHKAKSLKHINLSCFFSWN